jgi:hypothetical protein
MTGRLVEFYGQETAEHVIQMIRMISFGNLAGNTFDAFISRLKGSRAPGSSPLFEAIFFVFSAPILLPLRPRVEEYR